MYNAQGLREGQVANKKPMVVGLVVKLKMK